MVLLPAAMPVARPVLLPTTATVVLDEVQTDCPVTLRVELSVNTAVAANWATP